MPKMKSHSGAAKRFRVTASGKLKRNRAYAGHLFQSKSSKQRRRLRQGTIMFDGDAKRIKRLMPYA